MARPDPLGVSNSAWLAMQAKQPILIDSEMVAAIAPNQTGRFCTKLGTGLRSPPLTTPYNLSSLKSTPSRKT